MRPTRASTTTRRARPDRADAATPTATSCASPRPAATRRPPRFTWDIYLFGARADGRSGQRQPVGPHRRQRLLQPRRHVVQRGDGRPAVDPDRRRRLHRRHQLHDAGGAAGQGRRRRREDHHQRRRRDHRRRRRPSSARRPAPTGCAASWSARRTARSPASPNAATAARCSSTSSTRARPRRPRTSATRRSSAATGRRAARRARARPRS